MGGDGGVIAANRKFMRGYKHKDDQVDKKNLKEQQRQRSNLCTLTTKPLVHPIVACELGNLYTKEELVKVLLDKLLPPALCHIRGLKDIKSLIFTPNPCLEDEKDQNVGVLGGRSDYSSPYICPITRTEFNGSQPFVFIWTTGYVLSEKAIKEIGIEGLQAEFGPFVKEDFIKLLPLEEEMPNQLLQFEERRSLQKKDKKNKKKDNKRNRDVDINEDSNIKESKNHGNNIKVDDSIYEKIIKIKDCNKKVKPGEKTISGTKVVNGSRLNKATSLVNDAKEIVKNQEVKSAVFKGLFHKDLEGDKKGRDLFMSVSGLRYTLS
jgi:hypothetical protein